MPEKKRTKKASSTLAITSTIDPLYGEWEVRCPVCRGILLLVNHDTGKKELRCTTCHIPVLGWEERQKVRQRLAE